MQKAKSCTSKFTEHKLCGDKEPSLSMISRKKLHMLLWSHYLLTIRKCIAVTNQWATAFPYKPRLPTSMRGPSVRTSLINASKCKALTVTHKRNPLTYNYHLNRVQLERAANEKDVPVNVTRTLSWDQHVHTIISKESDKMYPTNQ